MENLVALCKRRGFIFPSSEIYGGIAGFWDYGPLGSLLKKNIKDTWWKDIVQNRDDIVGMDASIIMNPKVWEASGHTQAFTDPLVECKYCHKRFRADKIEELLNNVKEIKEVGDEKYMLFFEKYTDLRRQAVGMGTEDGKAEIRIVNKVYLKAKADGKLPCPFCLEVREYSAPKNFNLLTEVMLGVTEPKLTAYLRGEITQGVHVNFKNVTDSTRVKIPFGIAQIGKAFRNEITPGNFTFRSREFEQMEVQYFVEPNEAKSMETYEFWKNYWMVWYSGLGIKKENLRFKDHADGERAHYAKAATDIEYKAPWGWAELMGVHHRGDWDLSQHNKHSGKSLNYKDQTTGQEYTPWDIESSAGVDRSLLFFLLDAYRKDEKREWLQLDPKLAPYKAAVFPLVSNKPDLVAKANEIYHNLRKSIMVSWDDRGNIGKRYAAQDEVGTPFCITVDYTTLEDQTVTVRERDSMEQKRVAVSELESFILKVL